MRTEYLGVQSQSGKESGFFFIVVYSCKYFLTQEKNLDNCNASRPQHLFKTSDMKKPLKMWLAFRMTNSFGSEFSHCHSNLTTRKKDNLM